MRSETNPSAQRALEEASRNLAALKVRLTTIRAAARRSAARVTETAEETNGFIQAQNALQKEKGFSTRNEMLARAKALLKLEKANSAAQADRLSIAAKEVERIELEMRIDELRLSIESARGRP